ncbi:MAG: molybdopterin molybdotransferase MoeA [Deltaproteobacteria bacterium]|nr:molybdopterin molybdotransferase MoeA [Deltaproteobacteria bacterium]
MDNFFKVKNLEEITEYTSLFSPVKAQEVNLFKALNRVLYQNIKADANLPDFKRSTMDGYAVCARDTYGASEANPAYLTVKGAVKMGKIPSFSITRGEAANISTGGMLPKRADSVVMIEHTDISDNTTIEVLKSAAQAQHVIEQGEDYNKGETIISAGTVLRAQEIGLLAAFGKNTVKVFKKPKVGIISTGDEIVNIKETPEHGKIRDVNTYTLFASLKKAGADPISYGIVQDDFDSLFKLCQQVSSETDMLMLSGGSSVGTKDYTVKVFSSLPNSEILAHGISISPGKPTILANASGKALWGLPGHIVSAMVVFEIIVKKFVKKIAGCKKDKKIYYPFAKLTRNISSAQGRVDFIRVKTTANNDKLEATPVLGKSGLLNSIVKADALIKIDKDTEGLNKGDNVRLIIL